jgi:hypothetical protein
MTRRTTTAVCRGCQSPIWFALVNDRVCPIDPDPVPNGPLTTDGSTPSRPVWNPKARGLYSTLVPNRDLRRAGYRIHKCDVTRSARYRT